MLLPFHFLPLSPIFFLSIHPSIALHTQPQQLPLADPDSDSSSPFTASFDKMVSSNLERWHTPGLAIGVVDGGEVFSKGYGIATLPDEPITPETLFYTASTTKSFTAAAVSILIDDSVNSSESISWQVPLAKVMREDFVLADEYTTSHVTLEDALSHRTGMPRHDFSVGGSNVTVRDVVRNFRQLPLTAEIRTRFQYCNLMYIAVSHFIETWTGMWLGDFLRTRIYEPLGMVNTFFSLRDARKASASGGPSLATPYYWNNQSKTYHSIPWLDAPQDSGCGAMISNVLDYAQWLRCMMTGSDPLSPAGHRALRSPRMSGGISTEEINGLAGFRGVGSYALGWEVSNYRGEEMIWHTGGLPGFVTIMMYFPRLQWGITMMANGGTGGAMQILIFKLIDDMLGIPKKERYDWVPSLEQIKQRELEISKNARTVLYPNAPKEKDSIPLSLPLESYAGTYTNEGYPSLILTLNGTTPSSHTPFESQPILHCILPYGQYPISLSFQHVSGEYFLIFLRWFSTEGQIPADGNFNLETDLLSKAEFRLGEDGQVKEMGVLLEAEMGGDMIWFEKENEKAEAKDHNDYKNHLFTTSSSGVRMADRQGARSGTGVQQRAFFPRLPRVGQGLAPLFAKHA